MVAPQILTACYKLFSLGKKSEKKHSCFDKKRHLNSASQ